MTDHIDRLRKDTSPIVAIAASAALLYVFSAVLWPFALAFTLAVLISGVSRLIVKILPKAGKWAIFFLTALAVGAVVMIGMLVIVEGTTRLVAELPDVYQRLDQLLGSIVLPGTPSLNLREALARFDFASATSSIVGSFQGGISGLGLTSLFLMFLLASRPMIERKVQIIVASRKSSKVVTVLERSIAGVEAYVLIQSVSGFMIAASGCAVMLMLGLDNALFWSLMIFMFAFLPVVGVLIGSIGPTLFALIQFPTIWPAIIVFGVFQLISFVVGSLFLPKLQADSQNIDPSAGVLAVGIWTVLWGIPGAFLAIPLTLALMYALAQYDRFRWIAVLISNDGIPSPADDAEITG